MHQILLNLISIKEVTYMKLTHVSGNLFVDDLGRQWRRYTIGDTYGYEMVYNPALGK